MNTPGTSFTKYAEIDGREYRVQGYTHLDGEMDVRVVRVKVEPSFNKSLNRTVSSYWRELHPRTASYKIAAKSVQVA